MHEFLSWVESSALGGSIRESGPWTYAFVNLAHIIGVSLLFGAVVILDLRLLGFWRRAPLAVITDATRPVAAVGFVLAATTGAGLLSTNATDYVGNPFFLAKFPAIALGLINVWVLSRSAAWQARRARDLSAGENRQLALGGALSLVCWVTAVAMGRLIGYW